MKIKTIDVNAKEGEKKMDLKKYLKPDLTAFCQKCKKEFFLCHLLKITKQDFICLNCYKKRRK